jgi:farnesyl-diphosphate farnesyltransferase
MNRMQRMDELLVKTSRTFALAIPLLPAPTRSATCLAYLLFRIADTLEDAQLWPRSSRLKALEDFADFLGSADPGRARDLARAWTAAPPTANPGYLDLLNAIPEVFAEVAGLDPAAQQILFKHAIRTTRGMRDTLAQADELGRLQLATLQELQGYCYIVAGIVGELLTELFVHDSPSLVEVEDVLAEHQAAFGEGLQLVNILKDQNCDAGDGRAYLPASVPREDVIALARRDIGRARLYIDALERGGAPAGFVGFTTLSADLADATLTRLEKEGVGAKVSRSVVMQMFERVQQRIAAAR